MSPYPRYRISEPTIGRAEITATARCLTAGELTISGGHSVRTFEERLADLLQTSPNRVVACSSGTTALHLALADSGLKPGARVLVPGLTYVATVAALRYIDAVPVFVDVDPVTWTIDRLSVARLASDVDGIIPVDLYGFPALDITGSLAPFKDKVVIHDCCQSLGLPTPYGAYSRYAIYSFYANKLITTGGEGGAVVAQTEESADRIRRLRGQGQSLNRRYWHEVVGFNYRITAMQAAFGVAQLAQANTFMVKRKMVADVYREELGLFEYQRGELGSASIDWLFSLLVPRDRDRDAVMAYLHRVCGIETRPVFPNVAKMPPYVEWATDLPVTDDIANRGLSLPVHPSLTPDDASTIARAFKDAVSHSSTRIQKGA